MYCTGIGSYEVGDFTEDHEYVALARSIDGVNWVKHDDPTTIDAHHVESDPVFRADTDNSSAWDSYGLSDTNVQQTENGLTMIYRGSAFSGSASVGVATSQDRLVWARSPDNPVITNLMIGTKINFVSYLRRNDKDFVYMEAVEPMSC